MPNSKEKYLRWIIYLSAIFFTVLSAVFLGKDNLIPATGFLIVSFASYAFLIIKDYRALSVVAFITLILSIFTIMGIAGGDVSSEGFLTAEYEKTYYLSLSVLMLFIIPFCTHLITAQGWRKTLSRILLIVSIGLAFIMGVASPTFHTNFIYTRIFVGIIFIYSIYSIFRKEKLPRAVGIIGIFASLGALVFGAIMFSTQIYTIEGTEKAKVVNFIEPKVQDMFLAYNQGDSQNFCKYCREDLKAAFTEETLASMRGMYGQYISHEGPDIIRVASSYHIDYIVKFEKMNPIYFTLTIEQAEPENTIYEFSLSPEQPVRQKYFQ